MHFWFCKSLELLHQIYVEFLCCFRTDAGVHALNTTCHVDLYRNNGLIYNPQTVTIAMNSYFKKQEVPIRILRTYLVPQDFHSRHNAILRTYLYRIIVCQVNGYKKGATNYFFIPVEELDRAYYIWYFDK